MSRLGTRQVESRSPTSGFDFDRAEESTTIRSSLTTQQSRPLVTSLGLNLLAAADFTRLLIVLASTHFFFNSAAFDQFSEPSDCLLNCFAVADHQLDHCFSILIVGTSVIAGKVATRRRFLNAGRHDAFIAGVPAARICAGRSVFARRGSVTIGMPTSQRPSFRVQRVFPRFLPHSHVPLPPPSRVRRRRR